MLEVFCKSCMAPGVTWNFEHDKNNFAHYEYEMSPPPKIVKVGLSINIQSSILTDGEMSSYCPEVGG